MSVAASSFTANINGDPAPQGSKIPRVSSKGKAYVQEQNSAKHGTWRQDIIDGLLKVRRELGWDTVAEVPVEVWLDFRLPRPASVSIRKRPFPHVKPDLDKLVRAFLDAATIAGVFQDDAQVIVVHASKRYATDDPDGSPGALFALRLVPDPMII